MTWGWRWNEQCSANKSTNAANYVSRLNKAIAHFEQNQIDLQQSAYWSLSNRTGITVSLALLPPAWIAMAFPCSSEPMKMSNIRGSARAFQISCI